MPASPPDGFAEFVAVRSPTLLRTAWLLTGDAGKAEDLLQTVPALVWPRWTRVVEGGNPEAYVRQALYTTYLSWRRRRWRFETPTADLPEPDRHDAAHDRDPARGSADRDALRRALARLSPQQRAIVVLRYVEDLSVSETAQVLGCSEGTVKVPAGRALANLRANPHLRLDAMEGLRP